MFLLLLDDLAKGLKNGMGKEEKAEIKATFLYTFVGVIIPPYCQTRCVGPHWNLARNVHEYGTG